MFNLERMRRDVCSGRVEVPDGLTSAELHEWMRIERIKRREFRNVSTNSNLKFDRNLRRGVPTTTQGTSPVYTSQEDFSVGSYHKYLGICQVIYYRLIQ